MTAVAPTPIAANGHAPRRRPVRVEIDRHALVGQLMDQISLAEEARDANGASLQTVLRLPPGPWRQEMQAAHHFTHDRLTRLLSALREAAGTYDGRPDRA